MNIQQNINIFVVKHLDLGINLTIFEDLEKQQLSKKFKDYFIIKTNVLLGGVTEETNKFNTLMNNARVNGFTYLQVLLEE